MKRVPKLITVFHTRNCIVGIIAAIAIGVICAMLGLAGMIAAPLGALFGMVGGFLNWWWHFEWTDRRGEWA